MKKRAANSTELALWRKYERYLKECTAISLINKALHDQFMIAVRFGLDMGQAVPMLPVDLGNRHNSIIRQNQKHSTLYNACMIGELGIFKVGNDLNITAPDDISPEELSLYTQLGAFPFMLISGIIIVGAIIAAIYKVLTDNQKLTEEYNKLLIYTDKQYCAVPGSNLCESWLKRKEQSEYKEKENIIQQAKKEIASLKTGASSGLTIGLALGIPLVLFILFSRGKAHD